MAGAAASTPLLEQYEGVKARYPGHLVLFRVGDFFETFGEDARLLSKELDVVLTARGPDRTGDRVPMAGVPQHAIETYLGRLVRKGYKVALCDQVEDARKAQGLVRRDVTRVVTPGTVVEETILGGPEHSFLASVALPSRGSGSYSAVDVTTGEWLRGPADGPGPEGLVSVLAALGPREILFSSPAETEAALLRVLRREFPAARLEAAPPSATESELPPALRAAADPFLPTDLTLVAFLKATQPRLVPHVTPVPRAGGGRRMLLDTKSLRHLEISRPMNPDDPGGATLLSVWDATVTAPGRRTLHLWLTNPLADVAEIRARHDAVAALLADPSQLEGLRRRLTTVADLGRIASRVAGRRSRADELGRLRDGLRLAGEIADELSHGLSDPLLLRLSGELAPPTELLGLLEASVPPSVGGSATPAELLRSGFSEELDRARAATADALAGLAALERREQEATAIKTLKVGYNQVFGHYLEVSRSNLVRVPERYRRRQTVAQAERFVTDELLEASATLLDAEERTRSAAEAAWEELCSRIDRFVGQVHRLALALGALDALATFAHLAEHHAYVRPEVDDSRQIVVRDGRHPVLDRLLGERFVPNDAELEPASRLLVLTGPNMSGKSTYMRQVGLLVVLAQAGSFVPARYAKIGLVTELFTRMGFTDEIGRAKSSFMVEMSEVATILAGATDRSLVLLDEVGRGTSTFDGLALAWATVRYLHDERRSRAILATHYHQLSGLVGALSAARNAHFAVREQDDDIVFLHRLVPGATDRSYGVHVARLAGVPEPVLAEAGRLLKELERGLPAPSPRSEGRRHRPGGNYTQAVLVETEPSEGELLGRAFRELDLEDLSDAELRQRLLDLRRRFPREVRPAP